MKKLVMLLLFSSLIMSVQAQDDIVIRASKKTTIQKTPKEIIDSLKKRFPNAKAVQYYKTSAQAAKNGWTVTEQDNLAMSDEDLDMYTLSFKRDDFTYYALFNADGTLLKSKYQEKGRALPEAAKASLRALAGSKYQDYYIDSETYNKTVNHQDKKSYYEVVAKSKKDPKLKKTITIDESGKVLKVK